MQDWKTLLLSTEKFIDNEYLEEYITLISTPSAVQPYLEKHHVIPVAYYKHKYNLDTKSHRHEAERYANADPINKLVLLSFMDHCKAHWLLAHCTVDDLAAASVSAFLHLIAGLKTADGQFFLAKKTGLISLGLTPEEYEAIQQQAVKIRRADPRYWSPEQIQWLKENRPKLTLAQCAEHLGKTTRAVACQCTVLGIKRCWRTEEDDNALLEYSTEHTAKECAEHFGISEALVIKRWRELGFSKTFKWDTEKDNWLRDNDSKYSVAELAEKLGTTKTTVMGRRWTLGITRYSRSQ